MAQFDKDLSVHLKSLQKQVKQILKTMKKPLLDYNIQFEIDSMRPDAVTYSVWIQPPDGRLNRLSWIGKDYDDLMEKLKTFDCNIDSSSVEIAYHAAQIEACKSTIQHHEDVIKELVEKRDKPELNEKEEK